MATTTRYVYLYSKTGAVLANFVLSAADLDTLRYRLAAVWNGASASVDYLVPGQPAGSERHVNLSAVSQLFVQTYTQ